MKNFCIILLFFITTPILGQSDDTVLAEIDIKYQQVVDKATDFFEVKQYEDALQLYTRAHDLKPTDPLVIKQIEKINAILNYTCVGENAYEKVICKADRFYEMENYQEAMKLYDRAMMLNVSEAYPHQMIEKINAILKEKE